ncbi:MAG: hypothetical protein RR679_14060 [Glutamicibacter sp.]|uniref:hypothetical protein n=1 Tax=Glutamicibacter sp. TaxID=1931995 RepID=UPI002FC82612
MTQELQFVQSLVLGGAHVILDARKWSTDSVRSLLLSAKNSGATVTVRNATAWLHSGTSEVHGLSIVGKKSLILDFTS